MKSHGGVLLATAETGAVTTTTSKTSMLNLMLLRAWRERWTDSQFGINVKSVLPRGVSGDVYNLADCILQQAVVGSDANRLVLSYLRHSLCSQLISHAAVLKRISKYDRFDNTFCVIALLEFLEGILSGVTCRSKPEEMILGNAVLSLAYWLADIYKHAMDTSRMCDGLNFEQTEMVERCTNVLEKLVNHQFLMGVIFVAKHEDHQLHADLNATYLAIKNDILNASFAADSSKHFEDLLKPIALININHLVVASPNELSHYESITYCLQPLLAVKVLQNPNSDTKSYVADLQMIQRLKNYSLSRLYFEVIRACLVSLFVSGTNRESIWCAFTFIKVPHIIKELSGQRKKAAMFGEELNYCPDVIAAFEMLLQDPILDYIDTKCACNTVEYLLTELTKQGLVNESQVKEFSATRVDINTVLSKIDQSNPTSIIRFVICAETPFTGILKALCADYSKMQEPLLGMFVQVLSGNSLELILSVASVEGKLKTFVSRLINCNESSLQSDGDKDKATLVKASLFDVSFLMLTCIVQTYGSEVVLDGRGNSFFERWVRECMTERKRNKNPYAMIRQCDSNKVDDLLMHLNSPDSSLNNSAVTWQDTCLSIPSILYHVLLSWENETISTAEVKANLDTLKSRMCAFSVCAVSWLSSYMQVVRDNELLKPLNMVHELLAAATPDDFTQKENFQERHQLASQIIRKMQQDVHPTKKARVVVAQNIVSANPLEEQFADMWRTTMERGWVPIDSIQTLECLLQSCGPFWLVSRLIDEILQAKYTKDMLKSMDVVFSLLHLNIEACTISLLTEWLPMLLMNCSQHKVQLIEPQSTVLARLCVMCILATMEATQDAQTSTIAGQKRRSHQADMDAATAPSMDGSASRQSAVDLDMDTVGPMMKTRKIETDEHETMSSDFVFDMTPQMNQAPPAVVHGPLHIALLNLFQAFAQFVSVDQLSPKICFISQFLSLLVQLGGDPVKPLLRLMPPNLIQNLLRVIVTDECTTGFILRIYELETISGRRKAIADLALLRSVQLRNESIDI